MKHKWLISLALVVAVLASLAVLSVIVIRPTSTEIPSRSEFQQHLLYSASIEGGKTTFASIAADAGCPGPAIYDQWHTVQDIEWLRNRYGNDVNWYCVETHEDADYVFRLAELRESCGPAVFIVNVRDENGAPLEGRAVIRYWPGAPVLPFYEPPASRYADENGNFLGIVGWTSASGDVGFGVGHGDAYFPETGSGVTEFYIADYDGPSDWLGGIGWLDGTQHCTLFSVFWRIPKEDVDPPTPTPGPTGEPVPLPEGLFRVDELYIQLEEVPTPTP